MGAKLAIFSEELKRKGLQHRDPPPTLFHYTTAGGFAGIVESRNIRATNFSFMNDPSEIVHGRNLVRELVREAHDTEQNPLITSLFKKTIDELEKEGATEIYVSCFTTKSDDLSQWRAYGASVARYALEFETRRLHEATITRRSFKVRFAEVVYDLAKQREAIRAILRVAADQVVSLGIVASEIDDCVHALARRLTRILPLLKAEPYQVEDEWRIILLIKSDDARLVRFDTSRGVIRSYVDFPLTAGLLPLKSVLVLSPSRPKAAEKAARLVLDKAGLYSTPVRYSGIPVADV